VPYLKQQYIELMDTTLRDGEQTHGLSFSGVEKLTVAKFLLQDLKVDRIEVASARVSRGELESVKGIAAWARENDLLEKVEVLGFVDFTSSVDWINEAGGKTINLLAKGSERHCRMQLGKTPGQHFADVEKTIDYAVSNKFAVNIYLEDFSNGIKDSRKYVFDFIESLSRQKVKRIMLPDTLGVLTPTLTREYVTEVVQKFPELHFDFHAHNDYGLATANSLEAVLAGVSGVHGTINALGERTGNGALEEIAVAINDHTSFKCNIDEANLIKASKLVERLSGKRVPGNKPIVGSDVFTQTAGIHADGDVKGNLYVNKMLPERFGRTRSYALGKLSGKASIEQNLRELGIELTKEQKKALLERVVELGDKKEIITKEDLPFLIDDIVKTPEEKKIQVVDCKIMSAYKGSPSATVTIKYGGKEYSGKAEGVGGYDAFMNALRKIAQKTKIQLAELEDFEIRIPPGGRSDAIVETTIYWRHNNKAFRTIGVDSDQVMATIKATEKMLNTVVRSLPSK
jgi:D-citramalate synthase